MQLCMLLAVIIYLVVIGADNIPHVVIDGTSRVSSRCSIPSATIHGGRIDPIPSLVGTFATAKAHGLNVMTATGKTSAYIVRL